MERKEENIGQGILKGIRELAEAYTPEWHFDVDNPDAGSVIGLIFAGQLEDNVQAFREAAAKYRIEFVNLYGGSLQAARPAEAVVIMEGGGSGVYVKKGTQLTGTSADGDEVIFETAHDLSVTGSVLRDIVCISGRKGRVVPCFGDMRGEPLFKGLEEGVGEDKGFPAALFGFEEEGIYREALLLSDGALFDGQEEICLRFEGEPGAKRLAEVFSDESRYRFSYYDGTGKAAFKGVKRRGEYVVLEREKGEGEAVIFLERRENTGEPVYLSEIGAAGADRAGVPDFVHNTGMELDPGCFRPFGEQLSVYQECYIGQDDIFSRKGAWAKLEFGLSFGENFLRLGGEAQDGPLPVIKRRQKYVWQQKEIHCFVQEISAEYFNGTGWKRLPDAGEWTGIFSTGDNEGRVELTFVIPGDWQPVTVGGDEGRCIRLQVTRADDCYMRPALHHYPVIRDLKLSCSRRGRLLRPERVERLCGRRREELSGRLAAGESVCVFGRFPYSETAVYFGFDRRFEEGPVSIYFALREGKAYTGPGRLRYEYSSPAGFRPFRVTDNTDGLRRSGTVLFDPPSDMISCELEGRRQYWLKITAEGEAPDGWGAVAEGIWMNGVAVRNVETREPREYFIDKAEANMSFPLYASNILDARVWVNETEHFSRRRMKELILKQPESVKAEYGAQGEIDEFYVLWEETDSFLRSGREDRHYVIDRMNGRILFGDGVHVKIPDNTSGAAFRVSLRCCSGSLGNVLPESIYGFRGSLLPVGRIWNPMAGFGGADAESTENALFRSSSLLACGGRLISGEDYERAVMAFSPDVAQVRCLMDAEPDGAAGRGILSLAILMRDYKEGPRSFRRLQKELEGYLKEREELCGAFSGLRIVEPVFVKINAHLWLTAEGSFDAFSIKNCWRERLEACLEPVRAGGGWEIGRLPTENQLQMLVHTWEKKERVRYLAFTAAWSDAAGEHETEWKAIPAGPFMLCCSGEHEISVEAAEGEGRLCSSARI